MTITELHEDREKLAAWLGRKPFQIVEKSYQPPGSRKTVKYTEDEFAEFWREYRDQLHADWTKSPHNPHRPITWKQFVAQCIRASFGMHKGTLEEKKAKLLDLHPELYERHSFQVPANALVCKADGDRYVIKDGEQTEAEIDVWKSQPDSPFAPRLAGRFNPFGHYSTLAAAISAVSDAIGRTVVMAVGRC